MVALDAALEAGADAVYLGLNNLNARRGAQNFSQAELVEAVAKAHERNARIFLTLNIDLATREIGETARCLQLAVDSGVDAVLFADAALLKLKEYFPALEFHFSTQASVTSSAGVRAAARLGIKRVVLAREMSLAEINAAAEVGRDCGVEVEVFVQGALCMCVSGRCLISSWGGGRSGNRGACTSPCRVRWNQRRKKLDGNISKDNDLGTLLAMRDLCAVDYLAELARMGVSCVKIEGRLKSAGWVHKAVDLYRRAFNGEGVGVELESELGAYAGREMTAGYLEEKPQEMTGEYGRPAAEESAEDDEQVISPEVKLNNNVLEYNLEIISEGEKLVVTLSCESGVERWEQVKTLVRHAKRAVSLEEAAAWLRNFKIQGAELDDFACDDKEFLLPRKAVNTLADKISAALHRLKKSKSKKSVEVEVSEVVRDLVRFNRDTEFNPSQLGHKPNMVRLEWEQAEEFLAEVSPELVVVEKITAEDFAHYKEIGKNSKLAVALPSVFFEHELASLREFCAKAVEAGFMIEVNGWDGFELAKESGAEIIGGPGVAVLNPLAGAALSGNGFTAATYSLEAGQKQFEDLSQSFPLPGILYVHSRPLLACTRAVVTNEERLSLEDSRGIRLELSNENGLCYLRATEPFSIAHIKNENIKARYLCADFIGAKKALKEWNNLRKQPKNANLFNYERGLY